jgi:transposase-like protein
VGYSVERKEAVLKKMLPPESRSIPSLSKEEGISEATLYNWRKAARRQGRLLPDGDSTPEGWSARDKFNAVVETAALSEAEKAEYCRRRGLYPEQIEQWRRACEQANDWEAEQTRRQDKALRSHKRRANELEKELKRKEAALAETAALLTLRKKAEAIWGDGEAD